MRGEDDKVRFIDFKNGPRKRVDEKRTGTDLAKQINGRLTYLNLTAARLDESEDPLDNLLANVMFDCLPGNRIQRK
ncbi:MAG TPA: hypothetical protein VF531_07005 [Bacillota bacterium]